MKTYSAAETAERLPYPELARGVGAMVRRMAEGLGAPPRIHAPLPGGGILLVMPASDEAVAVTKLVTVHPGNRERGLPLIQGEMVVMDAATGERLALLDGPTVTARRTAALSLFAAQTLAPRPDGPLLVVGAGVQARGHLEAFVRGLNVREVYCASRSLASAESLAEFGRSLGVEARAVATPAEVLDRCPLVVTVTTSPEPVLPDAVPEGVFIAAVGSFTPQAAEIPAALMRSARVVADTEDAFHEAGDLIQAGVGPADAELLSQVLDAPRQEGTVVFKSVGHALYDLAAARLAVGR